jgi:hypothetical protein
MYLVTKYGEKSLNQFLALATVLATALATALAAARQAVMRRQPQQR